MATRRQPTDPRIRRCTAAGTAPNHLSWHLGMLQTCSDPQLSVPSHSQTRWDTPRKTKTYAIPHALPTSASVNNVCMKPQNPTSAVNSRSKSRGVVRSALWYAAATRLLVQRTTEIGERSTVKSNVVVLCFEDEQKEGCTREGRWMGHDDGRLQKRLRYQQSIFDKRVITKK